MDSEAPALTTAEGKAAVERWLADVLAQSDEKLVGTEEQAQAWAEAVKRSLTLMLCNAGAAGGVLRYSALDGLLQTDRNPDSALEWLGGAGMRRVCQYAFTKNDIDALDSAGFCTRHGGPSADPIKSLNPAFVSAAQTVLSVVVGFLLDCAHQIPSSADLAAHSEGAFAEALGASDGDVVVVLHHDDVHNRTEFEACGVALMDREPTQMSADFRNNGESYASKSLLPEGSAGESHYDRMVALAKEMTRRTFMATIRAKELQRRLMFADVLVKWLHKLSLVSDATCALICQQLQRPQLDVLLAADVYLPRRLSAALHDLYLTLMADAGFKMDIAEAYVSALPALTEHYVEGRGVAEYSIQSLSVQFLNRSTFVQHLVQHNGLLPTLAQCLYDSLFPIAGFDFSQASDGSDNYPLVLKYRRYMPTFGDLRCVLAIDGIARQFAGEGLELWLQSLALLQGLDGQRRQTHAHVEYEHRSWVHAFNVNITVCSAFDLIVSWLHDPVAGIDYPAHISQEDAEAGRMPHPLDMLRACLQAVRHHEEAQARLRVRAGAAAAQAALSTRRLSAQLMMDDDLSAPSEQQAEALPPPVEAPSPAEAGVDDHGMVPLPVFPHGGAALQLAPLPALRSFHAPLHRFLAAAVGQAARCAARTPDVQTLAAAVTQQASAGTNLAAALVDVPLQVLVLVSEVLNCADPPFSRLFKDLDLFAIQFAAIGYGANPLINHILHRYRCWEWWLSGPAAEAEDHKDEPGEHDQATAAADYNATNPNRSAPVDAEEQHAADRQGIATAAAQLLMGEGCLLAMINVITELPPPPDETQPMAVARAEASAAAVTSVAAAVTDTETISVNTRVWAQLRRELVHRLAVAPCTFSELQEASHMVGQADALPSKALDVLLSEIATQNGRGGVLEGVKYTLRPQLYKEYDPSFPHITRQMHQLVAEKLRPSPRQSPEPSGNRAEDSAAAEGAAPVCPPPPPAHSCFNHLRAELLSDGAMARLIASALRGLLAEGVPKLLLALKGCSWLAEERTAVGGIAWLLRELRGFGYGLGESIPDEAAASNGGGGAALAARKAAAQARAMAAMQERAKMFAAAQMRAMGVDSDEEDLSDADMDQDQGSSSAHQGKCKQYVPPPPPICIACHEVTAEPVGHIAFAHRSSVLDMRANAPDGVPPLVAGPPLQLAPMNGASQIQPTEADYKLGFRGFAGVHLHLCGHALHSSCFARYYDSVRGQTDIFGRPVTDLDAGEFRCPFCKALSNVLVPHVVPPLPESPEPSQQQPQASPAAAAAAVEAAQEEEPSPAAAEAPMTSQEAGSWLSGAQFVRDVALVYFGTAAGGDARAAAEPVPHEHYVAALLEAPFLLVALVAAGSEPLRSTMASAAGAAMLDNSPGGPKLPTVFTTPLPKILLEVLVMLCAALPPASAAGAAATADASGSGATSGAAAATDAAGDALRMAGNPAAADVRAMCGVACVARLVQLLIGAGMGPDAAAAGADHEGSADIDVACAYARAVLSDAVARATARDTGSTGDMEVCGGSGALVSARPCFADLDPSTWQHLLAFMRCCALFAEIITDGAALPPEQSDDEMASLCGFFGMPTSLTAVLQDRDVRHLVSLWLAPLTFALELVQLRYLSYPVGFSVRLVDLPKSYTDLHALLTSTPRPPSDAFPAVCLVCGQAVSCGGDGSCWKHAAACSPNAGVFFLLQECTVLLTRGKRAAYFASPYVDAYGERHRQPRGRPLFMDERRYSVLRDLYARHAVAAEVARIRSSGREVLHAGYY
ncbi:hypothetical protein JKP88DRAFT_338657 [Tribonema minus]|uniref:E3 ubiquitin-protein ligase n=1 Tax=Tribonema minus TaxID=303371 RepID=A0A835YQN3_9STRA|nr:hypothetical protein JKP88DRAFT_338657 [Tribonema minus]